MSTISGTRRLQLDEAALLLLDARRTGQLLANLPEALRPTSLDEAYVVQDRMADAYGPIGGWKVGGPPTDVPFYAPMPREWMAPSPAVFRGQRFRGIEAEIAFQLSRDLPPRSIPYTRDEILNSIAVCAPAIELLEIAYLNLDAVPRPVAFADMQMHGGFIHGSPFANWRTFDFAEESVQVTIDGAVVIERKASNPAGTDLIRLLIYLANECTQRTGGLNRGEWITTGSWIGFVPAGPLSSVTARFAHAGSVSMSFA
jgi:2-keto-4-pentenoate hydratase